MDLNYPAYWRVFSGASMLTRLVFCRSDVLCSLKSLEPLGPGVRIFENGNRRLLYFNYREFNQDVYQIITLFEVCISPAVLAPTKVIPETWIC